MHWIINVSEDTYVNKRPIVLLVDNRNQLQLSTWPCVLPVDLFLTHTFIISDTSQNWKSTRNRKYLQNQTYMANIFVSEDIIRWKDTFHPWLGTLLDSRLCPFIMSLKKQRTSSLWYTKGRNSYGSQQCTEPHKPLYMHIPKQIECAS